MNIVTRCESKQHTKTGKQTNTEEDENFPKRKKFQKMWNAFAIA
jgi:hypothetical protein